MDAINTDLHIFCPRSGCEYYQQEDNPIEKAGTYPVKSETTRRQLFRCIGGRHKFSETKFSHLWHQHGSFKEYEQAAKLKTYGLSTAQIADVLLKSLVASAWEFQRI